MSLDPGWVFLGIGLFCGISLIILMLLGGLDLDVDADTDIDHDMDVGAGGPSPLSLPVMFSFGATFGISGYIINYAYGDAVTAAGIAAAIAVIVSGLMYMVMVYLFRMGEASTDLRMSDLIGEQGEVRIPIEKGKIGQVLVVTDARGRTLLTATSDQDIPSQSRVTIVGVSGDRVIVEPVGSTGKTRRRGKGV